MSTLTLFFIIAILTRTGIRLWLAMRHIRHIHAHRHHVPDSFSTRVSLDAHQKAADYTCEKTRLQYASILVETALLLALTLGGGLDMLYRFWSHQLDHPVIQDIALAVSTVMLMSAIELLFSYYRTFTIEQKFGFNTMTPAMFLTDLLKHTLLALTAGIPLLAGIVWIMQTMGTNWWLYAWLAWITFNLLVLAVYPTWIAPLFNTFTPLQNTALQERIEQLLEKCGFRSEGLFVMDGSRRSNHGNAYFTGFGRTRRIVFFDTLLSRLEGPEIEAVLAHELGHFTRHHVIKRIVWSFTMSLAGLWLLGYLMQQSWFYEGLGVSSPTVPAPAMALLLFFMAMPAFTWPLLPLSSLYSRKHEFEADEYAASRTSANDLILALVKLYQDNAATLTPDPLHSAFYDSHPPAAIRIARLQNLAHNH